MLILLLLCAISFSNIHGTYAPLPTKRQRSYKPNTYMPKASIIERPSYEDMHPVFTADGTPYRNSDFHIIVSAANGDSNTVYTAIQNGADINCTDYYGVSPLMLAAANGRIEIVKYLIKCKADINLQDFSGKTALIYAVINNDLKITEILLNAGADKNIKTKDNKVAHDYARTIIMLRFLWYKIK